MSTAFQNGDLAVESDFDPASVLRKSIFYVCSKYGYRGSEDVVEFAALTCIVSGSLSLHSGEDEIEIQSGSIGLVRRNQLLRTMKRPDPSGAPFRSINILFHEARLREYASEHSIAASRLTVGAGLIDLSNDPFLKGYFDSLRPYENHPATMTDELMKIKTNEAIELLRRENLDDFLFDFSEPARIDLEGFMKRNFRHNASLEQFAKLSGRSLSTFRREFAKIFASTPEKWIRQTRLDHAHFLIEQRGWKPIAASKEVGFESISHFSRAYKETFGISASGRTQIHNRHQNGPPSP